MKSIALIALLAVGAVIYLSSSNDNAEFENFLATYNKGYNSVSEYEMRKAIFEDNLNYINQMNSENHSFTLGMNEFGDLTLEEFKARLGYKPSKPTVEPVNTGRIVPSAHETVDWSKHVNKVKNQGSCGSCWAFSAVAALESAHSIAGHGLRDLSEQQLVDCDPKSHGCNGGEMFYAFEYYEKHGACFAENYPYNAKDQTCKASQCEKDTAPIKSHELIMKNDPNIIYEHLELAPLSLGVAAGNRAWSFYRSGVVDEKSGCGTNLDHGVLLAGYDAKFKT